MTGEISPRPARQQAQLRASHEDRDRVIDALRVAAGDGRLTSDELDERVEAAFTARTYGELAVLTADLPAAGQIPAVIAPAEPKDVVRIECRGGNASRDGRWVVPKRMEIRVRGGNVKLDFTQAVITQPAVDIDTDLRGGTLIILTRPGIAVDTDDMEMRGGNVKIRAPWPADVPGVLQVSVSGRVRGGNVVARPPRRTFWQWLTRKPRPYAITRAG